VARVLFVIYSEKQFRTFLETESLCLLGKHVDVDLMMYGVKSSHPITTNVFKNEYLLSKVSLLLQRSGTFIATLRLWQKKYNSRAHLHRAISSFGTPRNRSTHTTMILYKMDGWSEQKRFLIRLFGKKVLIALLTLLRNFLLELNLRSNLKKCGIQLDEYLYVMIPYSGLLSSEFDDLVGHFQRREKKVVAIQENWDNLSSKTFISSNPNVFLVWGEQSKAHLKLVHQIEDCEIYIAGSPRFLAYQQDSIMQHAEKKWSSEQKRFTRDEYVLLTGTGDGIDDNFILEETQKALLSSSRFNQLSLVYRPHPFTRNPISKDVLEVYESQGVFIDNNLGARSVFHHCPLIKNATLVINQFSTILLEALYCNNKVLLPTFVNRPVSYDYSSALNEWHHFIGLKMVPNVFIAENAKTFPQVLTNALESKSRDSRKSITWMISENLFHSELLHLHASLIK
jgi:hypothetical protein